MTTSLQPIETVYRGYRFRSRLEARWAVFFEALELAWEYEPQGYHLPSGPYLPDFYLTDLGCWCEVKRSAGAINWTQLCELADATKRLVVALDGVPDVDWYQLVLPPCDIRFDPQGRFEWVDFAASAARGSPWLCATGDVPGDIELAYYSDFIQAVNAARSARFEHGESPL